MQRVYGVDEISPEMLKALDVVELSWLSRVCVPTIYGSHFSASPGKFTPWWWRFWSIGKPWICEDKYGFLPAHGTLDQIFTLTEALRRSWELDFFVDLEDLPAMTFSVHWGCLELDVKCFFSTPKKMEWFLLVEDESLPQMKVIKCIVHNWC